MKRVTYLNLTDFSTYEIFSLGDEITLKDGFKIIEIA
jgi:hypothetical protein